MNCDPSIYKLNSIAFRIVSAKVLENYKAAQGFMLEEVQFGQYQFSRVSKEIILLYSDAIFKGILQVEQMLARSEKEKIDHPLAMNIISILTSRATYISEVMSIHKDMFDEIFVGAWMAAHLPVAKTVERIIESSIGENKARAFQRIGNSLLETLDVVRFELYEIDYLVNDGGKPFLVVSDICILSEKYIGKIFPIERAHAYINIFNIEKPFVLKDYSNSLTTFEYCKSRLIESDIKISEDSE